MLKHIHLQTKLLPLYNNSFFSDEVFQFQHLSVQDLLYFEFLCFYISVPYPAVCMATDNNEI